MRLLSPVLIALTLAACPATARAYSAACTNLSGVRVSDAGPRPTFTPDAVEGASWAYTWDIDTKQATLIFQTAKAAGGLPNTQKGSVTFHRGGFFTMVTSLPGAVWTHAIYADSGRLLVTQSTTQNSADLSGRMLVGSCKMSR